MSFLVLARAGSGLLFLSIICRRCLILFLKVCIFLLSACNLSENLKNIFLVLFTYQQNFV